MKSGIYSIINTRTGQVYIGSSQDVPKRWNAHRHQLRKGAHENAYLQRSWNKYGEDMFAFGMLEAASLETLIECEQAWIDIMPCHISAGGYNISPTAMNCTGVKHSDETKAKLSTIRKGVPKSAEHRKKIGEAQVGKVIPQAQRELLREAAKNQMASPEMRAKLSVLKKGQPARNKGVPLTDEQKAKLSASHKAFYQTEQGVALIESMRGRKLSDAVKKKIGDANRGRDVSVETRRKMSIARAGKPNPKPIGWVPSDSWRESMVRRRGEKRLDPRTPSPELVAEMIRLRSEGLSYAKVAKAVGKDVATVFRWCKRTD